MILKRSLPYQFAVLLVFSLLSLMDVHAMSDWDRLEFIRTILWHPSGESYVVAGGPNGCISKTSDVYDVFLVDGTTHEVIQTFSGSRCPNTGLAWNQNGTRLAISDLDARITTWDISGTNLGEVFAGPSSLSAFSIGWNPNENSSYFAFSHTGRGIIFNQTSDEQSPFIGTLETDISSFRWVDFLDNAVSGHEDGLLQLWDVDTNMPVTTLAQHSSSVIDIEVNEATSLIVSASKDEVIVTNSSIGNSITSINITPIYDLSINAAGDKLAIGTDGSLKVYDIATQSVLASLPYDGEVLTSSWNPQSDTVIFGGRPNEFSNSLIQISDVITPPSQGITSYTLLNADTDQDIRTLTNNDTIDLMTDGNNLNIRANTDPSSVGSVVFALSGAETINRTESAAPYTLILTGQRWTPTVGSYSLTATPYDQSSSGTAGTSLTINFSVVGGVQSEPD